MKKKAASIATDSAEALIDPIIKGIEEKKGKNIQIFDLRQTGNAVCDFFVICNADSGTQVDAIAYSVEHEVKVATGESPWRSEGFENKEWILVDYVNVVVHVFQTPIRDFYKIERLWADAIVRVIPESIA
ncbi:MAG: ribosome silencing factor [Bacteroidota bacterium]|jgi:ribosome-associated protein